MSEATEQSAATKFAINGEAKVGNTLTATMDSGEPSGVLLQWYSADNDSANADGTAIDGATTNSYTLTSADVGRYIYAVATGDGINYDSALSTSTNKTAAVADAEVEMPTTDDQPPETVDQPAEIIDQETVSDNATVSENVVSSNEINLQNAPGTVSGNRVTGEIEVEYYRNYYSLDLPTDIIADGSYLCVPASEAPVNQYQEARIYTDVTWYRTKEQKNTGGTVVTAVPKYELKSGEYEVKAEDDGYYFYAEYTGDDGATYTTPCTWAKAKRVGAINILPADSGRLVYNEYRIGNALNLVSQIRGTAYISQSQSDVSSVKWFIVGDDGVKSEIANQTSERFVVTPECAGYRIGAEVVMTNGEKLETVTSFKIKQSANYMVVTGAIDDKDTDAGKVLSLWGSDTVAKCYWYRSDNEDGTNNDGSEPKQLNTASALTHEVVPEDSGKYIFAKYNGGFNADALGPIKASSITFEKEEGAVNSNHVSDVDVYVQETNPQYLVIVKGTGLESAGMNKPVWIKMNCDDVLYASEYAIDESQSFEINPVHSSDGWSLHLGSNITESEGSNIVSFYRDAERRQQAFTVEVRYYDTQPHLVQYGGFNQYGTTLIPNTYSSYNADAIYLQNGMKFSYLLMNHGEPADIISVDNQTGGMASTYLNDYGLSVKVLDIARKGAGTGVDLPHIDLKYQDENGVLQTITKNVVDGNSNQCVHFYETIDDMANRKNEISEFVAKENSNKEFYARFDEDKDEDTLLECISNLGPDFEITVEKIDDTYEYYKVTVRINAMGYAISSGSIGFKGSYQAGEWTLDCYPTIGYTIYRTAEYTRPKVEYLGRTIFLYEKSENASSILSGLSDMGPVDLKFVDLKENEKIVSVTREQENYEFISKLPDSYWDKIYHINSIDEEKNVVNIEVQDNCSGLVLQVNTNQGRQFLVNLSSSKHNSNIIVNGKSYYMGYFLTNPAHSGSSWTLNKAEEVEGVVNRPIGFSFFKRENQSGKYTSELDETFNTYISSAKVDIISQIDYEEEPLNDGKIAWFNQDDAKVYSTDLTQNAKGYWSTDALQYGYDGGSFAMKVTLNVKNESFVPAGIRGRTITRYLQGYLVESSVEIPSYLELKGSDYVLLSNNEGTEIDYLVNDSSLSSKVRDRIEYKVTMGGKSIEGLTVSKTDLGCKLVIPSGTSGKVLLEASMTDDYDNMIKTSKEIQLTTIRNIVVPEKISSDEVKLHVTAEVKSGTSAPIANVYIPEEYENILNIEEYSYTAKTGILDITFGTGREGGTGMIRVDFMGGTTYSIPVDVTGIVQIGAERYILSDESYSAESKHGSALYVGSICNDIMDRVEIPATITYNEQIYDVVSILNGSFDYTVNESGTKIAGPRTVRLDGSNLRTLTDDIYGSWATAVAQSPTNMFLCTGSGELGRLENITVTGSTGFFKSINGCLVAAHEICEIPAYCKDTTFTFPNAENQLETQYVVTDKRNNLSRNFTKVIMGENYQEITNADEFPINLDKVKSFEVEECGFGDANKYVVYDGALYFNNVEDGTSTLIAYPNAKTTDAIKIKSGTTNIRKGSIEGNKASVLVIPDSVTTVDAKTNATAIYVYGNSFDGIGLTAPAKGVTVYGTDSNTGLKAWAKTAGYTYKVMGEVDAEVSKNYKFAAFKEIHVVAQGNVKEGAEYIYLNPGEKMLLENSLLGIDLISAVDNAYIGGTVRYEIENIAGTIGNRTDNGFTAYSPSVALVRAYIDDTLVKSLWVVIKPTSYKTDQSKYDACVGASESSQIGLNIEELTDSSAKANVLKAYKDMGVYSVQSSNPALMSVGISEDDAMPYVRAIKASGTESPTVTINICEEKQTANVDCYPFPSEDSLEVRLTKADGSEVSDVYDTNTGRLIQGKVIRAEVGLHNTKNDFISLNHENYKIEFSQSGIVTHEMITDAGHDYIEFSGTKIGNTKMKVTLIDDPSKSRQADIICDVVAGEYIAASTIILETDYTPTEEFPGWNTVAGDDVFELDWKKAANGTLSISDLTVQKSDGSYAQERGDNFTIISSDKGILTVELKSGKRLQYSIKSSDSKVAIWDDATRGIKLIGPGTADITAQVLNYDGVKDVVQTSFKFTVSLKDYTPRLDNTTFVINKRITSGIIMTPFYVDNHIITDLEVVNTDGTATEFGTEVNGEGICVLKATNYQGEFNKELPYKLKMSVNGMTEVQDVDVKIKVIDQTPTAKDVNITVPVLDTFFTMDSRDTMEYEGVNGYTVERIAVNPVANDGTSNEAFLEVCDFAAPNEIRIKPNVSSLTKAQKKVAFDVYFVGFTEPVTKSVELSTTNNAPKITFDMTILSVDTAATDVNGFSSASAIMTSSVEREVRLELAGDSSNAKKLEAEDSDAIHFGRDASNRLTAYVRSDVANGSYVYTITPKVVIGTDGLNDIIKPTNATKITIKVTNTKPVVNLEKGEVTLNRNYPSMSGVTALTFGSDVALRYPTEIEGGVGEEYFNINVGENGAINIAMKSSTNLPPVGKYSFTVKPWADSIDGRVVPVALTPKTFIVKVVDTLPKSSLGMNKITVDNAFVDKVYTIPVQIDGNYSYINPTIVGETDVDRQANLVTSDPNGILKIQVGPDVLAGKYKYLITPLAQLDGLCNPVTLNAGKPLELTVTVTSTRPTAKLQKSVLNVNRMYPEAEIETGYCRVAVSNDATITDITLDPLDRNAKGLTDEQKVICQTDLDENGKITGFVVKPTNSTPKGTYTYSVRTTAMNSGNMVALAKQSIKIIVSDNAPEFTLDKAQFVLNSSFGNVVSSDETSISDPQNLIQNVLNQETYLVKRDNKFVFVNTASDPNVDTRYAHVTVDNKGIIKVESCDETAAFEASTNLTLQVELKGNPTPIDVTVPIKVKKNNTTPETILDKAALNLNRNFDLSYENLESVASLKVTTSMADVANIVDLDITVKTPRGGEDNIAYYLVDAAGNGVRTANLAQRDLNELYIRFVTADEPQTGSYTFTITPQLSKYMSGTTDRNERKEEIKAAAKKFVITVNNTVPTASYETKLNLNNNDHDTTAQTKVVLNQDQTDINMDESTIVLKSYPKKADPYGVALEWQEEDGIIYLRAAQGYSGVVAGTYQFNVTPKVNKTDGSLMNLATKTVSVVVANTTTKAFLQNPTLNINSSSTVLSATTNLLYSGLFADRITGANYDGMVELISAPKNAKEGILAVTVDPAGLVEANCLSSNITAGTYKFKITPNVWEMNEAGITNLDLSTIKPVTLSVVIKNNNPKATYSRSSTSLNRYFANENAVGTIKLNTDDRIDSVNTRATLLSYPEGGRNAVNISFDETNIPNKVQLRAKSSASAPTGKYVFEIAPKVILSNGQAITLPAVKHTVTVAASKLKVNMNKKTIKFNTIYGISEESILQPAKTYGELVIDAEQTKASIVYTGKKNQAVAELIEFRVENQGDLIAISKEKIPNGNYTFSVTPYVYGADNMSFATDPIQFTVAAITKEPKVILKSAGGQIDLTNRGNTFQKFKPMISNEGSTDELMLAYGAVSIENLPAFKDEEIPFEIDLREAENGVVGVRAKEMEEIEQRTYTYRMRFVTMMGKTIYQNVSITPKQPKIKVTTTSPKMTVYKNVGMSGVFKLKTNQGMINATSVTTTNENFRIITDGVEYQLQLTNPSAYPAGTKNVKVVINVPVMDQASNYKSATATINVTIQN